MAKKKAKLFLDSFILSEKFGEEEKKVFDSEKFSNEFVLFKTSK